VLNRSRPIATGDNAVQEQNARSRHRQGAMLVVNGVPVPDPASTGNILVGTTIGTWLASHAGVVKGRLLDLGCGNSPYSPWYEPLVDSWVGIDPAPGVGQTVQAMADQVPLKDNSMDVVLCTEVLEHVDRSEWAVAEIARVLKAGGHALITAPFMYPLHEAPYDFHRFTHIGLRSIVTRNGLEVIDFGACGGPVTLVASWLFRALRSAIDAFGHRMGMSTPLALRVPFRWLVVSPQQLAVRLRPQRSAKMTKSSEILSNGYMILARKTAIND